MTQPRGSLSTLPDAANPTSREASTPSNHIIDSYVSAASTAALTPRPQTSSLPPSSPMGHVAPEQQARQLPRPLSYPNDTGQPQQAAGVAPTVGVQHLGPQPAPRHRTGQTLPAVYPPHHHHHQQRHQLEPQQPHHGSQFQEGYPAPQPQHQGPAYTASLNVSEPSPGMHSKITVPGGAIPPGAGHLAQPPSSHLGPYPTQHHYRNPGPPPPPPPPPPAPMVPTASAQAPAPAAQNNNSYRSLNISDALEYLQLVKYQFADRPEIYNRFLDAMKSFRSQSIDQLDVIQRVSDLFRGHPTLIVGFNTFLPPGYRIECGPNENDPVRVITPHATVPQELHSPRVLQPDADAANVYGSSTTAPARNPTASQMQHGLTAQGLKGDFPTHGPVGHHLPAPEGSYGQGEYFSGLNVGFPSTVPQPPPPASAAPVSIGQQRPLRSPPYASVASAVAALNSAAAASIPGPSESNGPGANSSNRRGPVEFDNAVTYVNKIKMRYAHQPEKYQQFLEILETFKHEHTQVQDVFAKIRLLFQETPDLVDGFQKYLPDKSTAGDAGINKLVQVGHYHGSNGTLRNGVNSSQSRNRGQRTVTGTSAAPSGGVKRGHAVRDVSPAPGSPSKSHYGPAPKRRKGIDDMTVMEDMENMILRVRGESPPPRTVLQAAAMKAKNQPINLADHPVHASLAASLGAQLAKEYSEEEVAFFETARKVINNKSAYQEFLKVLNLYTQDLLDKKTLVDRVESFLGSRSPHLVEWFRKFVTAEDRYCELLDGEPQNSFQYDDVDHLMEDAGNPGDHMKGVGRMDTTNWKIHGPSYRKMPGNYPQPLCSGRDELCREVLNDDWVSHPTWASEDNNFVVHRKSHYEEELHKIEEERYEFDMNIDANLQTIRLFEPLNEKIQKLSLEDRANFQLPDNFGGSSKTVHRRVIKKIYDFEHGEEVIEAVEKSPGITVPLVLRRLKQKHEEWREQQKEWNRAWGEAEAKNYYKALDLQGYLIKSTDKKLFNYKTLLSEIEVIKREQAEQLFTKGKVPTRHQMEFLFPRTEVFRDIVRFCFSFLDHQSHLFQEDDRGRVDRFFRDFVLVIFWIDESRAMSGARPASFRRRKDKSPKKRKPGNSRAVEDDESSMPDSDVDALRHNTQRRVGRPPRGSRRRLQNEEASPRRNTRSSSPLGLLSDSTTGESDKDEDRMSVEDDSSSGDHVNDLGCDGGLGRTEETRTVCMYGNSKFAVVIRLLQILYERLETLKNKEKEVIALAQERNRVNPLAVDLAVRPGGELASTATRNKETSIPDKLAIVPNPYARVLSLVDWLFDGHGLDQQTFEERMRSLYGSQAYTMFTVDRLVRTILRQVILITNDAKSLELLKLFEQDRANKVGRTGRREAVYRLSSENIVGSDDHLYRIEHDTRTRSLTIALLSKEDWVDNPDVTKEEHWSGYVDRYMMLNTPEGVDKQPFLKRNIQNIEPAEIITEGGLELKICVNTYKLFFCAGSEDVLFRVRKRFAQSRGGSSTANQRRASLSRQRTQKRGSFERWLAGRIPKNDNGSSKRWIEEIESTVRRRAAADVELQDVGAGGSCMPAQKLPEDSAQDALSVVGDAGTRGDREDARKSASPPESETTQGGSGPAGGASGPSVDEGATQQEQPPP